ncbi:MAG: sialidase family protein, partial [Acidobacteriota bacterium]
VATGGNGVQFQLGPGEVKTLIGLQFPRVPLASGCDPEHGATDCWVKIPDWVPLFSGEVGLTKTYATLNGQLSSRGTGDFRLYGQTGFTAAKRSIQGQASGGGSFLLSAGDGLEVLDGNLELKLSGTIANDVGILELIPGVKAYAKRYAILRKFNNMVKLGTQVSPYLDLAAQFAQNDSGDLAFSHAEGQVGLKLKGSIYCNFLGLGILRTRLWLAGDGTLYLELPEPLLREMILKFQAGAVINIRWVLREEVTFNAWCKWTRDGGIRCGTGDVVSLSSLDAPDAIQLRLIKTDYGRFGPYSQMKPRRLLRQESAATPINTEVTSMVANLFPGASPFLTNVGSGSLLLWEHQDPADPVLQSTEIAFSWNGGGDWSLPLLINDDTRAEFDPIASQDGSGGAVAAWIRSSDPNFDQVPGTFDDLAPFFKQMEIVTARFDPGSQSWTQPAPLTRNDASETDLHLAYDGNGRVWLTWLENEAGEPLSTAEAPSRLRYSVWDGSSWSMPADIVNGLIGVDSHSLAASPGSVVLLVPVDPDSELQGDERIDLFRWLGSGWSSGGTFAGGDGSENRHPSV